ncbi:MAG: hypothetical protein EP329_28285 [Deltaproteobacteria bacterium]|nr:MAG: hypothetical protein EP329_28285 [Deltaproteobacteria bacterium]
MTRPDDSLVARLAALLKQVRLGLEPEGDGWAILYEKERHPVAELPLDDLDASCEAAELLAVAAAFEAAVKYPGQLAPGEELREGAAPLLPKIERARFVRAYDAVVAGAGRDDAHRLLARDFGGGLVTCYVHEAGWRFDYVIAGRAAGWDTTLDTIHSVARSNLFARAEVDYRAREVAVGDGYDAARAIIVGDVFYDRLKPGGLAIAVPSRDRLFVGPEIDAAAVRAAYEAATYPISPDVLVFDSHHVTRA